MGSEVLYSSASHTSGAHSACTPSYSLAHSGVAAAGGAADAEGLLCSAEQTTDAAFATADSLSTCAQYLEPVLRELGLKQWQLHGGDAVAVLDRLFALVQQHQRLQDAREQLQDELHKTKVDVKAADKTIQRLQGQIEAKGQEIGGLNIKLRQLDAWYREEMERWRHERDELCRKCGQLEQRHAQFQHELRRRDTEFERLQKQLGAQIRMSERRRRVGTGSDSSSSTMVLSTTGSGISRQGSRAHSSSCNSGNGNHIDTRRMSKAEVEELLKRSVEALESEKQGLEADNAALRKALHSLEREHRDLLNRTQSAARCSSAGVSGVYSSGGDSHSSDTRSGHSSSNGSDSSPAATPPAATLAAADPAAALHRMHTNLQALKVRKQRVTGSTPLSDLQQQAESASERLLLAKLQEAGRIMEEQETALALALKAISGSRDPQGS